MALYPQQKRRLRQQAHALKPVILIGSQGLTDAVQAEIDRGLLAHELLKIRISGHDRDAKQAMITAICEQQQAELVQTIGHIVTIYRKNPEK